MPRPKPQLTFGGGGQGGRRGQDPLAGLPDSCASLRPAPLPCSAEMLAFVMGPSSVFSRIPKT